MNDFFTLGDLSRALAPMPSRAKVRFDNGEVLAHLRSYRGDYSHLALEPASGYPVGGSAKSTVRESADRVVFGVEVGATGTVAQVRRAVELAQGRLFFGYKGGEFFMDDSTPLHVAAYGNTSDTRVVGVRLNGSTVVVETAEDTGW